MTKRLPFTKPLYQFLLEYGYTHIQLLGIDKASSSIKGLPLDNFILSPKRNDITKQFEESSFIIEDIHSSEITDVLYEMMGMRFWIDLPEEVAVLVENSSKT